MNHITRNIRIDYIPANTYQGLKAAKMLKIEKKKNKSLPSPNIQSFLFGKIRKGGGGGTENMKNKQYKIFL